MAYITNDGEIIPHDNPTLILNYLRNTSFTPETDLDAFLAAMMKRVAMQTGHSFKTDIGDHSGIVMELCQAGLIRAVNTH
jgi:hypothetical protein